VELEVLYESEDATVHTTSTSLPTILRPDCMLIYINILPLTAESKLVGTLFLNEVTGCDNKSLWESEGLNGEWTEI
jgi:hypothetical protein